MSDLPLISVVVPTYNRPDFLIKTMCSILNQSYKNIELIIVSNGKSDDNENAAKSFNDDRVRYIDQENSGGPAGPRNHGMRLASGKYIAVCDDDDLWLSDKLEKQISAMEADFSCGLCYTHMIFFDESGREWSDDRGDADFSSLCYRNVVPISSVVLRADLVQKLGGFDESATVGDSEDYEFILRYAYHTKLIFINEKLLKYWSGINRTTATDNERIIADDWRHFKSVMGCHFLVIKKTTARPWQFILPCFYYLKICSKSSAYIICKRLGLVGR
ncbi:MAG: hypothetical protein COB14_03515 [Alphaproteobacteria bacterium]|nr:MAG: hypothetical protein COB14_03515 [Alphaproteobacteria bacterium]